MREVGDMLWIGKSSVQRILSKLSISFLDICSAMFFLCVNEISSELFHIKGDILRKNKGDVKQAS